ncbi:MAG: hypothetical protein LBD27_04380 [Tannerella sp.]|jgi:hypothetical protein|nr:hypothetical protein [Tannerella sp.]
MKTILDFNEEQLIDLLLLFGKNSQYAYLDERDIKLLREYRAGSLNGRDKATEYGLTRERVRQIMRGVSKHALMELINMIEVSDTLLQRQYNLDTREKAIAEKERLLEIEPDMTLVEVKHLKPFPKSNMSVRLQNVLVAHFGSIPSLQDLITETERDKGWFLKLRNGGMKSFKELRYLVASEFGVVL